MVFGVHVDGAGWLGSYGGEDSPADISRGLFAGEIGTMRLLDLFDRRVFPERCAPAIAQNMGKGSCSSSST
jgi:hypothetical protein